jgi:Ca-activated chloride channel family protein
MMVVTPGLDLQPLTRGADYVFVLDVSGSMGGKIQSLARGIKRALGELRPEDRFRVVTFHDSARELTSGWVSATPNAVADAIRTVEALQAGGSTNLYEGMSLGLKRLDDDRATSVVLVTDAVTNTGVIDPKAFHQLLKQYDVRVFGFLLGNSANWPLMRTIAEASGGFSAGVSNADDLLGQLLLAKSKITYESLHDAELEVRGVRVFDVTGKTAGKIYRGEQLVLFGHYDKGGEATIALRARLTGEDKTYSTTFTFPDVDTDNPEVERLWALSQIEQVEDMENASLLESSEVEPVIRDLGVAYQLVTDYTSMLVLDDTAFERHGVERHNRQRVAIERQAQTRRAAQPVRNYRVDEAKPMFQHSAPAVGGSGGSGALDPFSAAVAAALGGLALAARRRTESA